MTIIAKLRKLLGMERDWYAEFRRHIYQECPDCGTVLDPSELRLVKDTSTGVIVVSLAAFRCGDCSHEVRHLFDVPPVFPEWMLRSVPPYIDLFCRLEP
jgi:hypothetical protein